MALAQADFGAQEVGIAAFLSGDSVLIADYFSGDPYRQFATAALGVQSLQQSRSDKSTRRQCSAEFMASALPRLPAI